MNVPVSIDIYLPMLSHSELELSVSVNTVANPFSLTGRYRIQFEFSFNVARINTLRMIKSAELNVDQWN